MTTTKKTTTKKTIEYYTNGKREVIHKEGCHSCLNCIHCQELNSAIICALYCRSSEHTHNFPYDNTTCHSFANKDE